MAPIHAPEQSLFHLERITQYVSLSPASLAYPLPSLCTSIFSPLLLGYYPPAQGIVLAYQDVELSEAPPIANSSSTARGTKRKRNHEREEQEIGRNGEEEGNGEVLLKVVDEYSAPFLWATATLLVLRPQTGARVNARISHQTSTHITLSYLNAFSISVLKQYLPKDWVWQRASDASSQAQNIEGLGGNGRAGKRRDEGDTNGCWVEEDGMGRDVQVGDEMGVWIRSWDAKGGDSRPGKGVLVIEGSLSAPGEEEVQGNGEAVAQEGGAVQSAEQEQSGPSKAKEQRKEKGKKEKKRKSALKGS